MGTAVGPCALQRHGLVSWYYGMLYQTTPSPQRDGTQLTNSLLCYLPDIDADNEFIARSFRTLLGPMRLPTKERALVDYMRHLDVFELSYFVDGLHDYLEENGPDLLLQVAEHYGVRKQMQKWIDDDAHYENYG